MRNILEKIYIVWLLALCWLEIVIDDLKQK